MIRLRREFHYDIEITERSSLRDHLANFIKRLLRDYFEHFSIISLREFHLRDYFRDCLDILIERFIRGYFEVRFLGGLYYFSNVFGCFLFMLGVRCVLCAFHSTSCLHAPLLLIADGFLFL